MDKKVEEFIDNLMKNFTSTEEKLSGVLVCDKNGLTLTSKDVAILPGPVSRLAELGSTLLSRRAIISLEHDENRLIVQQTDQNLLAIYTQQLR